MCLIVFVPKGGRFPYKDLETIYENNPDGFGMMWTDGDRLRGAKGLVSLDEVRYMIRTGPQNSVAYHFRFATRGASDEDNVHPFEVTDRFWFMHNGTIHDMKKHETKSDTALFAEGLQKFFEHEPDRAYDTVFSRDFLPEIEEMIGLNNKMLFMGVKNGLRYVRLLNQNKWVKIEGAVVSNLYSFNPYHRRAYHLADKKAVKSKRKFFQTVAK